MNESASDLETGVAASKQTLYGEARAMLEHCAMIYTIAEYRQWSSNTTGLPLTGEKLQQLASECEDDFLGKYPDDGKTRVQLIHQILKSWSHSQMQIVWFEDENQKEELVYGIAVEPAHKRITLVFRGSVTANDWRADLRAVQVQV